MDEEPIGPHRKLSAFAAATGFVLGWMMLGRLLRLDAIVYLLLGVPLTVLFQLRLSAPAALGPLGARVAAVSTGEVGNRWPSYSR